MSFSALRQWWASTLLLMMALNLDQFGFSAGISPEPRVWLLGVFGVSLLVCVPTVRIANVLQHPLTWWLIAYFLLSTLWMLRAQHQSAAIDGLSMVATTSLLIASGILCFHSLEIETKKWRVTLWLALLAGSASVGFEYSAPSSTIFSHSGMGIVGRAAGLYLNPNTAALALVMILALIIQQGSKREGLIASLIALLPILLTFSRGGILCWFVLVAASAISGRLPRMTLPTMIGSAIGILVAGPTLLNLITEWSGIDDPNTFLRLAWLLGEGNLSDFAATERQFIADLAWSEFMNSPLLGYGLGYMWVWGEIGTHNLLLRHLLEYGIIGIAIYPAFLICSTRIAKKGKAAIALLPSITVAFAAGFFSHNILEQGTFLIPWLALSLAQVKTSVDRRHVVKRQSAP